MKNKLKVQEANRLIIKVIEDVKEKSYSKESGNVIIWNIMSKVPNSKLRDMRPALLFAQKSFMKL